MAGTFREAPIETDAASISDLSAPRSFREEGSSEVIPERTVRSEIPVVWTRPDFLVSWEIPEIGLYFFGMPLLLAVR
jgi:hypothetical protein